MSDERAIEAWSQAIREACEKHQKFLDVGFLGIQGVQCCAISAILFNPNRPSYYFNSNEVDEKLLGIGGDLGDLRPFLTGVVHGFDDKIYDDTIEKGEVFQQGFTLGKEMREKYIKEEG